MVKVTYDGLDRVTVKIGDWNHILDLQETKELYAALGSFGAPVEQQATAKGTQCLCDIEGCENPAVNHRCDDHQCAECQAQE